MNAKELYLAEKQATLSGAAHTQVGGDHYHKLAVQPWAAMEAWMTPEQFKGYLLGNAIKYLARNKNDVAEDHRKAAHYLQKLIEVEGQLTPTKD